MAQYAESLISYFDVLGFKNLVKNCSDPEEIAQKLRALNRHASNDGDLTETPGATFSNFSDLILRTLPIQENIRAGDSGMLYLELLDLVHVQAELIPKRVLLRGAITVGDIFVRDGITFGPGLIRAYELESSVALYPRVIVDPVVFQKLKDIPKLGRDNYEEEMSELSEIISRDADGVWFIDYLRAFQSEADHPSDYKKLLTAHRDLIQEELDTKTNLNSVVVKYGWLARYHNNWIQTLGLSRAEESELSVVFDSKALPALAT